MRLIRWLHSQILFLLLGRKSRLEILIIDGQIHIGIHFKRLDTIMVDQVQNPVEFIQALMRVKAQTEGIPPQLINTDFISGRNNAQNLDAH